MLWQAKPSILVVDDDEDVGWMLQKALSAEGYEVACAQDGVRALEELRRQDYALIILDINMPKLSGFQVCLRLRAEGKLARTPVLMLTGRTGLEDVLLGFEVGCDDYLTKPFDYGELLARVKALLRRSGAGKGAEASVREEPEHLAAGQLSLDLGTRQVVVAGYTLQLTQVEFDLLRFLLEHPNEIITGKDLLQNVWNYPPDSTDTGLVRWHIKNLRSKIEPDPRHPTYIRTIPRQGYMLVSH